MSIAQAKSSRADGRVRRALRPDWLRDVVRELQIAAGDMDRLPARSSAEYLAEFQCRLPAPTSRVEELLLRGLLAEALGKQPPQPPHDAHAPVAPSDRVAALLRSRYAECWTLERIGREIGRHKSLLTLDFRRTHGCSIHWFLTSVRMASARRMLATTTLKVDAVSLLVGYRAKKAFYKEFTRSTGMTPAMFRQARAAVQKDT